MAEARPNPAGPNPPGPSLPGPSPSAPEPSPEVSPQRSPKAEVDVTPLHKAMDRNKESLKVKLMLRRPYTQLVAQGIMPPLKTPPAFHEQRKQLERAKTGDLLKAKIQQRPDRQELVRQHILEADMDHVDPSLAERQRMLKKCRLADSLNDQLAHRPGPLELIQKNILHADETIERAVKDGVIPFKATCEGHKTKPAHPHRYITMDEDSQSSGEGSVLSPPGSAPTPAPAPASTPTPLMPLSGADVLETAAANAGIVTLALPMSLASSLASSTSSLSPLSSLSSVSSPPSCSVPSPITPRPPQLASPAPVPTPSLGPLGSHTHSLPLPLQQEAMRSGAPGKDKNRKKSKSKTQTKTRPMKFHEYKGPPNAHKTSVLSSSPVETSYELLLQQQQLLLQCQLDWLHKYPQIILPATQKSSSSTEVSSSSSNNSLGSSVSVSQTQTPVTSVAGVSSNGTQLGLITVTSSIPSSATGVAVNSLGSTAGTILGVGSGSGTLVLTTQRSASPQSARATVLPAPAPQTITVTLPPQQQQQAQVALQSSLQVSQPSLEPLQTAPPSISPGVSASVPTLSAQPTLQTVPQLPTSIKILSKLEDMKVCDLKMELKKRNLPVSGSKPQLIERIRNADAAAAAAAAADCNSPASHTSSTESSLAAQPMDIQMDVTMDTPHSSTEDSLSGFSADTASQPSPPQPSFAAPSATTTSDSTPSSINNQQMSPVSPPATPSPSSSVHEMDTTPISPAPSPVFREDLIREQQRQIKELQKQVKLLQSQQQQEILRAKEINSRKLANKTSDAATIIPASGTNGISTSLSDPSKAAVKQHLQNKIQLQQQQQLQVLQLQQLQQQQLQQQQQLALQQQQGLNAKASLAAFLQQQQSSLPSNNSNNNTNNNNNNTIINNNNSLNNLNNNLINKKFSKTLVVQPQLQQVEHVQQSLPPPPHQLQQQQAAAAAALVLNHINAQNKKGLPSLSALSGITGANSNHQRTNSLPNFLASMVQLAPSIEPKPLPMCQQRASSVTPMTSNKGVEVKPAVLPTHRLVLTRTTAEPHILTLTTAPAAASSAASGTATIMATTNGVVPVSLADGMILNLPSNNSSKLPQYEDVASLLTSIKQEPVNEKSCSERYSVQSQSVDDVLAILIERGELPPSAAQDPTTPTTPGTNSVSGQPGHHSSNPNLCGVFNSTQDNADIFMNVFSPATVGPGAAECPEHSIASVQSTPPASSTPPPPPPPPLPHTSFAKMLPTELPLTSTGSNVSKEPSFSLWGGNNSLDDIFGSSGPPATSVDLKALGLDIEISDPMDFGQLDTSSHPSGQEVRLESHDMNMEAESDNLSNQPDRRSFLNQQERQQSQQSQHQQLADQLLATPCEFMDFDMDMDMDPAWFDSLTASSDQLAEPSDQNSSLNQSSILPSSSSSYIHMNGHTHIDSYDPLLPNNQDPLDLFSLDAMDSDFITPEVGWDKADFAT
ncbi:myocardin-related transcription factor B-like [Thrips palmi]|uniref:Myocardin-related transcription factor B-like n=1 Tax=Thrips palmi TaxID=161013 RepID=A0A6P8ZY30_THRPL|nr:myocardin-related transcription factor B-like [Thrips palmi]